MDTSLLRRLKEQISAMPVVDTHEHIRVIEGQIGTLYREPVQALVVGYLTTDFLAAGATPAEIELLQNPAGATDQKWPVFQRLWQACRFTGYARMTQMVLKREYGIDHLDRAALDQVALQLARQDPAHKVKILEQANIKAVLSDWLFLHPSQKHLRYYSNPILKKFLDEVPSGPPFIRHTFNLPYFHELRAREYVDYTGLLAGMPVSNLAQYEAALFAIIQRAKTRGAVAIKDQSAYRRPIDFTFPTRDEAEKLFNRLYSDPRAQLSWPEARPLDDYLFQVSMRFARELGLPVQIHTGHVTGLRNRVDKANAALLAPTLEAHPEVNFALFHGNWPYLGDLLFLAKSYPNVYIDLCWLYIIDPDYACELLRRAVMTVPQTKLFAFGGDYWDAPEYSAAHLELARQVIAKALAGLVQDGWVGEPEALELALNWLYNNPNRFYQLGLPEASI